LSNESSREEENERYESGEERRHAARECQHDGSESYAESADPADILWSDMTFGRACLPDWPLDPAGTYLNHGTVGVTPLRVLEAQRRIREATERAPAKALLRDQSGLAGDAATPSQVREAAAAVAAFVGAAPQDLVFVDNVTTGINAVLRSQRFSPGDEVLVTDHGYGAILNAARFATRDRGATVRIVEVPYPAYSAQELVARVEAAISPRTTLAIFDHIAAESAIRFPLTDLVRVCRERGVRVLVDGAHAPGVLPLDVPSLGVDWYAANLHKWACTPRSCGFLWASPSAQEGLHPAVISWGLDTGFTAEFDWVGTRDLSAWLAAPEAIAYLRERGVDAAWTYNHGLAWQGAQLLADAWKTTIPASESEIGFMVTVPLPARFGGEAAHATRLRHALLFTHGIEVQVHAGYGRLWARLSAQVYNELDDVRRLMAAVDATAGA
jgi:isopenicillin-N epimerase